MIFIALPFVENKLDDPGRKGQPDMLGAAAPEPDRAGNQPLTRKRGVQPK